MSRGCLLKQLGVESIFLTYSADMPNMRYSISVSAYSAFAQAWNAPFTIQCPHYHQTIDDRPSISNNDELISSASFKTVPKIEMACIHTKISLCRDMSIFKKRKFILPMRLKLACLAPLAQLGGSSSPKSRLCLWLKVSYRYAVYLRRHDEVILAETACSMKSRDIKFHHLEAAC